MNAPTVKSLKIALTLLTSSLALVAMPTFSLIAMEYEGFSEEDDNALTLIPRGSYHAQTEKLDSLDAFRILKEDDLKGDFLAQYYPCIQAVKSIHLRRMHQTSQGLSESPEGTAEEKQEYLDNFCGILNQKLENVQDQYISLLQQEQSHHRLHRILVKGYQKEIEYFDEKTNSLLGMIREERIEFLKEKIKERKNKVDAKKEEIEKNYNASLKSWKEKNALFFKCEKKFKEFEERKVKISFLEKDLQEVQKKKQDIRNNWKGWFFYNDQETKDDKECDEKIASYTQQLEKLKKEQEANTLTITAEDLRLTGDNVKAQEQFLIQEEKPRLERFQKISADLSQDYEDLSKEDKDKDRILGVYLEKTEYKKESAYFQALSTKFNKKIKKTKNIFSVFRKDFFSALSSTLPLVVVEAERGGSLILNVKELKILLSKQKGTNKTLETHLSQIKSEQPKICDQINQLSVHQLYLKGYNSLQESHKKEREGDMLMNQELGIQIENFQKTLLLQKARQDSLTKLEKENRNQGLWGRALERVGEKITVEGGVDFIVGIGVIAATKKITSSVMKN